MPVVADVDAELDVGGLEHGIAQVAGLEEKLLVETGIDLRDVGLPILAEVLAVGVDDRGGVVVHAGHGLLVDRNDHDHAVLLRVLLHEPRGVAVGNRFGGRVPLSILAGAEVGLREDFLEAQHLHAGGAGFVDEGQVRFDHAVPDLFRSHGHVALQTHLDQSALELAHDSTPESWELWEHISRGRESVQCGGAFLPVVCDSCRRVTTSSSHFHALDPIIRHREYVGIPLRKIGGCSSNEPDFPGCRFSICLHDDLSHCLAACD